MCDYILHSVKSRPAKVGDKLTTRDFGTGTRGFAASENATVAVCCEARRTADFNRSPHKKSARRISVGQLFFASAEYWLEWQDLNPRPSRP
jgi:hypothetical protein